jgi:hypothetical protein
MVADQESASRQGLSNPKVCQRLQNTIGWWLWDRIMSKGAVKEYNSDLEIVSAQKQGENINERAASDRC